MSLNTDSSINLALLNTMATDLNISIQQGEDEYHWLNRVYYSVIGLQMLTCLFDSDSDSDSKGDQIFSNVATAPDLINTVSMQKVLSRGNKLAQVFRAKNLDVQKIRDLYIGCGLMLHKSNRLCSPTVKIASAGYAFVARIQPWKAQAVSGLGIILKTGYKPNADINEMFGLQTMPLTAWAEQFFDSVNWIHANRVPKDVEYANITKSPYDGYFGPTLPRGQITLCRTRGVGQRVYSLIRTISAGLEICDLPSWRVDRGEYLRIALALRVMAGNSPNLKITRHKSSADLKYDYLLPAPEQNFVELLTWSGENDYFSLPGRTHRIVAIEILDELKSLFQRFGYQIQEVAPS